MIRKSADFYLPKDFVETAEGLVFAVVENGMEQGKVLCFLRYRKIASGWQKLNTITANTFLHKNHSEYLFYSSAKDAHLHAVPSDRIIKHYLPENQLKKILQSDSEDQVTKDLKHLCQLSADAGLDLFFVGITGSMLINAQKQSSDIDLVVYDRKQFFKAREQIKNLIEVGLLKQLSQADWQSSYQRRSCDLSFSEYVWHEQRKFNKAVINNRKFDLNFVDPDSCLKNSQNTKLGPVKIQAVITDDKHGFDYPAVFKIDSKQARSAVSYTATYTGQAFAGERVEISGLLEREENGEYKIIVGSTREAEGEYIKVLAT